MGRRFTLVAVLLAVGATLLPTSAGAIPAFARKYGVACSACHTNWPRLNRFGINFRDNGYRMNRERDNPVNQSGAYWPVAFRATVGYQWAQNTYVPVQPTTSNPDGLATTETGTFGFTGLDILTAGTLGEQVGFLLVFTPGLFSAGFQVAGPSTADLESAWVAFTRLFNTPYLNIRVGKGALTDLPNDQHRSYQLEQGYQIINFGAPGSSVTFTPAANYAGVEFFGHDETSSLRYDVTLINGMDATVNSLWSANVVSNPTLWSHVTYFFLTGIDGIASIEPGILGSTGWVPTRGLTVAGASTPCNASTGTNCVPGTGSAMGNFFRVGGDLHIQFLSAVNPLTLDGAVMYGNDSASLISGGSGAPGQNADGTPTQNAQWFGGYVELSYTPSPEWTFAFLYNRVVMLQQGSTDYSHAQGAFTGWDVLVRYNLVFSSRAALALHAEYSHSSTSQPPPPAQGSLPRGLGPPAGDAVLLGFDFAY